MKDYSFIGKGIYSISEVSKYTGVDARKIKRWTNGYRSSQSKQYDAMYSHDYIHIENITSLSFLDLIEIRFIDAFHKHGVSWKAIRIASEKAKDILGKDHPFSTRRFYTDKKNILTRIAISENQTELLDIVHSQYELDEILQPCLIEGIEFTDSDTPARWYPLGKSNPVIIDPAYNFGKPVIETYYIDTKMLYGLFKSNKTIDEIAWWYEIDKTMVEQAISYEEKLAS